ncbi:MAG TPA: hypothetical protein EYG73_02575 [Arcobacter sp.]|nr:hypothetical protein [Arcobacter sp.]
MKKLFKLIAILILLFVALLMLMIYITGNGVRDQEEYCEKFIADLDYYYAKNKQYPKTLMAFGGKANFNFRYSGNRCNYEVVKKGYIFSISDGLSFRNYESWEKAWRND